MDFRRNAVVGTVARFYRDERGDITNFMLPSFVALVFTTGLGIDLIRHEANRADLQNALDRGVLAATSFEANDFAGATFQQSGSSDPGEAFTREGVINRYVNTRTFNQAEATVEFDDDQSGVSFDTDGDPLSSVVVADASFIFNTSFLNLIGLPELLVAAEASANEGRSVVNNSEISLVLDISASMARETTLGKDGVTEDTRLEVMKAAAIDFINDNLGGPGQGGTSISLVPYSGHVNVGRFGAVERDDGAGGFVVQDESIFSQFTGGVRDHNNSSCIEFDDATAFNTLNLPTPGSSDQVPHFQNFFYERLRGQTAPFDPDGGNDTEWGWCPEDSQALVPFSNNAAELTQVVAGFHGHDGTGIQNGLKWGLGLLSPDSSDLVSRLIVDDHVPDAFEGRPAPFNTTSKTLILMTDGRVRYQNRPLASELETEEDRDRFSFDKNDPDDVDEKLDLVGGAFRSNNLLLTSNPQNFQALSTLPSNTARTADEQLRQQQVRNLCTLAHAANIRVFTIAFGFKADDELADGARELLQFCASEPADFFDVSTGKDLSVTFTKITRLTQSLRLFQ
ncbi:MAG: pilus assembly protein TadG-related protein [Pseudomonadota bacterium]